MVGDLMRRIVRKKDAERRQNTRNKSDSAIRGGEGNLKRGKKPRQSLYGIPFIPQQFIAKDCEACRVARHD